MKIAMMSMTMARGRKEGEPFDVTGLCEFTRELGLDGIDWVTIYGHDPAEVRRITDDHGLTNVCYTFFCQGLNAPGGPEREAGKEEFRRGIETARGLGADKIMLPCRGREDMTREDSYRLVMDALAELIGFAGDAGVTVTVENFPSPHSPFVVSDDVNRAVAELPELRVTFDNGNVVTGGEDPGESFRRSAPHVIHAHFKDFVQCVPDAPGARLGLDGNHRIGVLVGDGEVDQLGTLRAMAECGYGGYIDFEYEGSELSPREANIEGVRRMREWIASLNL
jgi:sugar phosphate isomerase/epimerase